MIRPEVLTSGLRVSKKSTLSRQKYRSPKIRRIFGLHSTPANTTHALLKTAYLSGFRLQGVFPPHMSPEKQNGAGYGTEYQGIGLSTD